MSVVTVTFNAREAFQTTAESVGRQTVRSQIEFLVIDGASTDGTVDEVRSAAGRGVVDRWWSEPDSGIYDAMNKAAPRAIGEYVLFLNAGDVFPAVDTVEQFLSFEDHPDYIWGDCEVDRAGHILFDPAALMHRFLYRQMTVCHQSLAVKTDLLLSHPFDISFRVAADYEVLCSLVTQGAVGKYRPIVVSRVLDEGFSSRSFFLGLNEKKAISRRFFPQDQWRARPYFALWGLYMKLKIWYKERS